MGIPDALGCFYYIANNTVDLFQKKKMVIVGRELNIPSRIFLRKLKLFSSTHCYGDDVNAIFRVNI